MSGYIGNIPVPQATQTREVFTATSGQTTFATVGYPVGFVDVWLNGVKLIAGTDFTATNGSDVVLTVGAATGDTVEVISNSTFEVNNQAFTGDTSAVNLTVTGAFTSRGIDDNATSTAVTLDASGRVGVGETTPSSSLHITENEITAYNGAATDGQLGAGSSLFLRQAGGSNTALSQVVFQPRTGYGYNRIVNSGGSAPYMAFATNNAERARIDASGNLLVSKTAIAGATGVGVEVRADGRLYSTSGSGSGPLTLNRTAATDGAIATFAKDGTTVGSIQSRAGLVTTMIFDPRTSGAGITGGGPVLYPTNNTGALTNNLVSLGDPTYNFKNLYLSGGVYLGGTGAANLLDDYETGAWTPTAGSGTLNVGNADYIKIGNLVWVSGFVNTFSDTGTPSNMYISGLPFAVASGKEAIGSVFGRNLNDTNLTASFGSGVNISFYGVYSGGYAALLWSELTASSELYFSIMYHTDA